MRVITRVLSPSSSFPFSSLTSLTPFSSFPSLLPRLSRQYSTTSNVDVKRAQFGKVDKNDIDYFKSIMHETGVLTEKEDLQTYNVDWMHKYKGNAPVVLRPKTSQEVSSILKYCSEKNLAVVPQGGNTGLVGGSVPVFDEVIINLGLMSQVESFDATSGVIVCEAGIVLDTLEKHVEQFGYTIPLDLGAKGSCQIGGNVSTNAGGIRLLRYGSLHANVLGLEVVLPNGEILDTISTLRKDNTGYDLKQLFIGSEGTLGIITKLALLTPPRPTSKNVSIYGCRDFEAVKSALAQAKKELGEILSAFEFLDRGSMDLVLKHMRARDPFDNSYPFYALIETSGSNKEHDREKLEAFLEKILGAEIVTDGVIAENETQVADIWKLRESITEALQKEGAVYKYDLSLPLTHFYKLVEVMQGRLAGKAKVVGYGHVGDGNLHLNVSAPKYDPELYALIEPFVYEYVSEQRGSISAEHGLGLMKASHLHFSKSDVAIEVMKKLKTVFDPKGIMNPYKVLPNASVSQHANK